MMQARWLALVALLLIPAHAEAQRVDLELGDPAGPPATDVPPPPGYGVAVAPAPSAPPRARRGGYMPTWPLLVPGLAAFVVSYGSAALAGGVLLASGITEEGTWLLVPVVGPMVLAGELSDPGDVALFVALGIAEAAGLAFIIAGLAINQRAESDEPDGTEVSLAPLLSPEHAGVAIRGRF